MTNEQLTDAAEVAAELRAVAADIFADAAGRLTDTVARPLDAQVWATLESTGLARLTGSESSGGSDAGWLEAAAVLGEAASAGVPLPLLEHDLLAGWLRDAADLPVPASAEAGTGSPADAAGAAPSISTAAEAVGTGRPVTVPWLPAAASVVVLDSSGERPQVYEMAASDLVFDERSSVTGEPQAVAVLPTGVAGAVEVSEELADEFRHRGALGRAVQMAGAAEAISRLCVEHVTTRVQFGRPIGRFQAVQQLVTDVASEAALTRTIVDRAVLTVAEHGMQDARSRFVIAAAKACAGGAAETIVRNAHQIHGAIGTTLEHSLQRRTRPVMGWRREFGSTAEWEARIEGQVLDQGADLWELITA
ncbi:acyl-CoA dehydrogenase family protein [Brevibacterium jeotgali]|uniref:Acyl-CoA dehydrogenase n=1 Tax=Brevibacterium jeotgali TaxID=1262550 RepID=A0A2H1L438_9MICO|nr:acyl-CoA dehydrogenase family protein [Brevibacterium jeotgali]TWC01750.1 acyl-CoA dehydrogenase [Brevibacterium jeotgali]SMY11495.1 acyl-CoA dehydrogenase [Brevibacterium jeotgali]